MIGAVNGKVKLIINTTALLETNSGIFFWVKLPPSLIEKIKIGNQLYVLTHLHITENEWFLYGFENYDQYFWFKLLLNVDSIGPKLAFSIISYDSVDKIITAIKNKDIDFFTQITGVGKKSAARIILELGNRLEKEISLDFIQLTAEDKILVDALKQLGFPISKINQIIKKIPKNQAIEERLKFALKLLGNVK